MIISDLFNYTEEMFPCQYSNNLKLVWVNQLEKEIYDFITQFEGELDDLTPHENLADETLIDEPDIYALYISARADFANAEYARYNNKVAQFNTFFEDWKSRYLRSHRATGTRYIRI